MHLCQESSDALITIRQKGRHKRIVFVSGNFNIIHPGHLRLLRFARECGDYLVVGVLDKRSEGAFIDEELRLEGVRAISWVDHAFMLHDPPERFVAELRPAFVVKGKEHEQHVNPEEEVLSRIGGKLLFGSGDIVFSSIDLIRQEWKDANLLAIRKPKDYPARHGFDQANLLGILRKIEGLSVCVIGDSIIDEYITCDPLGMSQEDPTIVVVPLKQEKFVGGAAIVAAHAKGLGALVRFFTIFGQDEAATYLKQEMQNRAVETHAYTDASRPTTLKQRYRASESTLLRVSHVRQHAIISDIRETILRDVQAVLHDTDLLIFADFNYGCLPQPLVDEIASECISRGIMMAADSQSSSQVGDISRFHDMTLLTPTEREARLAVRDFDSGLVVLADKLRTQARARNVLITLGAEGVLVQSDSIGENVLPTDRLPAFNTAPRDVAGAGDSFLIAASMALAVGANIWQSAYFGSLAAACQVSRVGNLPLSIDELVREIER